MERQSKTSQYSPILNVMVTTAYKAARGLVKDFGEIENLQVSRKGPGEFVSASDLNSEKTIMYELSKARPGYSFLLEEGGKILGEDQDHTWIVDPLDGTTNFLHGVPHFAISIGLKKHNEIVAGVIYDPIKDEMFIAEKGRGAFMNDRRIRVSGRREFPNCLLGTGVTMANPQYHQQFLDSIGKVLPVSAGLRRMGAASLDLAYVAAGRLDGYWEYTLKPWDVAAGIIIVKEAGGVITTLDGAPKEADDGTVLAGNPFVQEQLLKILR
jgi:myo-inositol-1(or 4)-monophosphatase